MVDEQSLLFCLFFGIALLPRSLDGGLTSVTILVKFLLSNHSKWYTKIDQQNVNFSDLLELWAKCQNFTIMNFSTADTLQCKLFRSVGIVGYMSKFHYYEFFLQPISSKPPKPLNSMFPTIRRYNIICLVFQVVMDQFLFFNNIWPTQIFYHKS